MCREMLFGAGTKECGEAYLYYGKALLQEARWERNFCKAYNLSTRKLNFYVLFITNVHVYVNHMIIMDKHVSMCTYHVTYGYFKLICYTKSLTLEH